VRVSLIALELEVLDLILLNGIGMTLENQSWQRVGFSGEL
jgi:hypothetical protein